jgi:ubiquinone/menaquinone biosynthesis C-methylase UbiE
LLKRFLRRLLRPKDIVPAAGYDLWAGQYDLQPDNLMLAQDELVFGSLLENLLVEGKIVADIGCGTGRHWQKILNRHPAKLLGFDVSGGMLKKLHEKFPQAETFLLKNDQLAALAGESVDLLLSTLTIAHIPAVENALHEWNRVLKHGGRVIITDYHPVALAKGGNRSFKHENKTISIVNHVHSIEKIKTIAGQLGWTTERLIEKEIDGSMKPWYDKQQALSVFEKFKGTPLIYGIQLIKDNAH